MSTETSTIEAQPQTTFEPVIVTFLGVFCGNKDDRGSKWNLSIR